MKTKLKYISLGLFLFACKFSIAQSIYVHDFGTTTISAHPYTVTPVTFDANLQSSSWSTSIGSWTPVTPNGSSGKALGITLTGSSATMTLTFNVASGWYCNITSFNFWRQKSNGNGPPNIAMTINGTSVGTITNTPNSGVYLGSQTISGFTNLTGTVTIVLTLSGGASGGTFRLDDFTLGGSVTNTPLTTSTDYFRSRTTGNWSSASTWESSSDNVTFYTATAVPTSAAASITIQSGHTVTVDAAATASLLTVDAGGTLNHTNGISLTISNGSTGYDFIVNGTYILNGTQASISGSTTAQINGTVRADANTNGESDDFARNTRVLFTSTAVFQWNNTSFFETSGVTYFPNSGSFNTPTFRITQNLSGIGATANTYFFGKMEVSSGVTVSFVGNGAKYFLNGIGGGGTLIHQNIYSGGTSNCGTFIVGGDGSTNITATIDGTINILIYGTLTAVGNTYNTNDFQIASKTTVTISGTPTITIGKTYGANNPGAQMDVSGTLINNNTTNPIDLTLGRLQISGSGLLSSSSTGTFKCSSTFTKIISAGTSANTSVGVLKLTTGYNTVYSFNMGISASVTVSTSHRIVLGTDVNVANDISLYQGILVTDYKKLTLNYTGASSIVYPTGTSYANSFIATCDQNGSALVATGISATTTSPFTGSVGFTINNVSGVGTYIMFPIGYNFGRPSKIAINPNTATSTNITVVVTSGDILYTPLARVNRIWYVYTSNQAANSNIGVRLYFTKYNWNTSNFGSGQDEIEDGFDYTSVYVGRRDYTTAPRLSHRSAANNLFAATYNTEVYAEYTAGYTGPTVLPGYYKFSVGNFGTIILPVTIANIKAYKSGNNVAVEWAALHELNIDHYEVEHSANGASFSSIATVAAVNNGSIQNNYTSLDQHPFNAANFYRIKIIGKDGSVNYSSVVSVNISGSYVGIKVQPNPVTNKLVNLQLSNLPTGKYNAIVYSISGQLIYSTSFTFNGGYSSQLIALPKYISAGTYVLKLSNEKDSFTQTIAVQ